MYNATGGTRCVILLDSNVFYPGQTIIGRVECNFPHEDKVRAIRVRFRGRTKVKWQESRNSKHKSEETYFEMESNLLTDETIFPPGSYSYPFNFTLPNDIPPTFTEDTGNIKYSVQATIDRPWAIDYTAKGELAVHSFIDLNNVDHVKNPVELTETKKPFALFGQTGAIMFTVRLPVTGYVPNEMIAFTAKVRNESNIPIQEVRFQLVQGFSYHTVPKTYLGKTTSKTVNKVEGQEFAVIDSLVESGSENSWDLELRVPPDVFTENLYFCKIIKTFFELRGELALSMPRKNLKMVIPLILGCVPLKVPAKEQ